ncbi:MAG: SGNH/GDSL hydrolase family protein [Candidatus Shapirobacteria bacterium]
MLKLLPSHLSSTCCFDKIKKLLLVFASFFLIFLSIFGCYFIAEKFFFDKFFYQKSVLHGYYPNLKPVDISQFGERSQGFRSVENNQPIFSSSDTNKFKVMVIGDSFVWGVGIKNNQRYAKILETKLNKIRPTKVVSISYPGWNSSELLKYYLLSTKDSPPDLTIFSLVHNDSLLSRFNRDDQIFKNCLALYPQVTPIVAIDLNQMIANNTPLSKVDEIFNRQHDDSWSNSVNLCVLDSNLVNLPTEKSVYFLTDDYGNNNLYRSYGENLKKYGKKVISSHIAQNIPKYSYLWQNGHDPYKYLTVSSKEAHPNSLANQMYADVLYNEIISNPEFILKK